MATQTIISGAETFGAASAGDSFYVLRGGQAITGNVDYSAVNQSVLAEISGEFSGTIGSAASPWQTSFTTRMVWAGRGTMYWEGDAADSDVTPLVQCIGPGTLHFINIGTATRFEAISGVQLVGNGTTITTGRFSGSASYRLQDTGTGATITLLECAGGDGYSQRPHTTITGIGGRLMLDADSAGGVNAHGTINAYGTHFTVRDSGTITLLNWRAGTIDVRGLARPLTITDINIDMTLPGAQALLDHPLITYTNTPARLMTDGRKLN